MVDTGRWSAKSGSGSTRAMGTAMAAIVLVVILVVVGVGSYLAFNGLGGGGKSGTSSSTSCEPAGSAICKQVSGGHDLVMTVPYRSVTAGVPIPFTAQYAGGASNVQYYLFDFGNGHTANSTSSKVTYSYPSACTCIASVQAKVKGSDALHDNYQALLQIPVNPSTQGTNASEVPIELNSVLSNTSAKSTATVPATGLLSSTSDYLEVSGSYAANPTNPRSIPFAPSLVASPGGNTTSPSSTNISASGKVSFGSSGAHWVTFVAGATSIDTGVTHWANFTWTVIVAPVGTHLGAVRAGGGSTSSGGGTHSKHPGTLDVYELIPAGSYSEDPAYDYETAGYEPILNVYQSLIAYNGSLTGPDPFDFVPQLATCVPGSVLCEKLYGAQFSGINGTDYTFELNPNARFYDPANGKSWPVYPSDVVFSLARTMAFSTGISWGSTNGWIVTQALVGPGNAAWDSSKGQANTTPQNIYGSMSVNDSKWCPSAAMTGGGAGCVTFHANAGGKAWPYFLELIADALGSAVVPCGAFTNLGSGIPMWTNGTAADTGDHPCTLPGGATSTTDTAFTNAVAAMDPKGFDTWAVQGSGALGTYLGQTQWSMVGSGPYYMKSITPGTDYLLQANPAYVAPCNWQGCEPAAGTYASTVSVIWEQTQTPGEQAYQAGIADFASIPSTDSSILLNLVNGGTISLTSFSSISIFFNLFNMNFSASGLKNYFPGENLPTTTFYAGLALRQFLVNAYPYSTIQSTINTINGLTYFTPYGGAIPNSMAGRPTNISWPAGDPSSDSSTAGTAGWWWAQGTNPSSPYYDSAMATACTVSSPCSVPALGELGAPDLDQRFSQWAQQVKSLSGGAMTLSLADTSFLDLVIGSITSSPGTLGFGLYTLGWAPDYPDATDYVQPMYTADSTYTYANSVMETLSDTSLGFNNSGCGHFTDPGYWAIQGANHAIPENCQGAAYGAMQFAIRAGAHETNATTRLMDYWEVSSIANGLALYQYWGQENIILSCASYINVDSANSNPTIGGGADATWYSIVYLSSGNGISD